GHICFVYYFLSNALNDPEVMGKKEKQKEMPFFHISRNDRHSDRFRVGRRKRKKGKKRNSNNNTQQCNQASVNQSKKNPGATWRCLSGPPGHSPWCASHCSHRSAVSTCQFANHCQAANATLAGHCLDITEVRWLLAASIIRAVKLRRPQIISTKSQMMQASLAKAPRNFWTQASHDQ
ncbi:hypothetical protein TNCV_3247331, partial [Trichonephila clavipes]